MSFMLMLFLTMIFYVDFVIDVNLALLLLPKPKQVQQKHLEKDCRHYQDPTQIRHQTKIRWRNAFLEFQDYRLIQHDPLRSKGE